MIHAAIWRTRAFPAVVGSYLVAAIPALFMLIGVIVLIEINYRLSTQPESALNMRLFGLRVDPATPWPWIAAGSLTVVGFCALRRQRRRVSDAWSRAIDEAARHVQARA